MGRVTWSLNMSGIPRSITCCGWVVFAWRPRRKQLLDKSRSRQKEKERKESTLERGVDTFLRISIQAPSLLFSISLPGICSRVLGIYSPMAIFFEHVSGKEWGQFGRGIRTLWSFTGLLCSSVNPSGEPGLRGRPPTWCTYACPSFRWPSLRAETKVSSTCGPMRGVFALQHAGVPCTVRIPMSAIVFVSRTPDSVANWACKGCRTAHQYAASASSFPGGSVRASASGAVFCVGVQRKALCRERWRRRRTSCSTVLLSVTQSSESTGEQKTLCRIANCRRTHSQWHAGTSHRRCCLRRENPHAHTQVSRIPFLSDFVRGARLFFF